MVLEAAEAFIKEPSRLALHSRLAAVAYVGRSFRQAISVPDNLDDIQVCTAASSLTVASVAWQASLCLPHHLQGCQCPLPPEQ